MQDKGKLGMMSCITILVGGMVGSAIFSLSGLTYAAAGPATILTWVLGGVILLLYGLQTAELCTIYPESGGSFVFPYKALGSTETAKKGWGWAAAWALLNVNLFGAAFSAVYIATYLGVAFPFFSNQILWAVVWVVLVGVLCMCNISVAGTVNLVLVVGLIITMLIYAFTGFGSFNAANFSPFFTQGAAGGAGFIGQIPTAMLAYGAIVSVAFMIGQVKNPKKTVPRSMLVAMVITIVMYVLVILSTIGMVAAKFFIEDPGMQYVPLYAAAWTVLYNLPWLPGLISIAATLALTTTMLVLLMTAGWTVQAAADYGMLPKGLAKINPRTGTPVNALVGCTLVVLLFSVIPAFTGYLVNTGAICMALCVVVLSVALLSARKGHIRKPDEFHVAGGAVIPVITIVLVLVFILPVLFQPLNYWLLALAWFAVGAVLFLLFRNSGSVSASRTGKAEDAAPPDEG